MQVGAQVLRHRAWAFPAVEVAEAAAGNRWRLVVARAPHRMDSIGEVQFAGSPRRLHPDAPTPLAGRTHRGRRRWAAAGDSDQVTRHKAQTTTANDKSQITSVSPWPVYS
jgi:hypothetical protein